MTFLGNYQAGQIKEASLPRSMILTYVRQYFKRDDFPKEFFIVLADTTVATKGDVVWPNIDCEHPFDFVPMCCIDQLVLNLPSKNQFLEAVGAKAMEDVNAETEGLFWQQHQFDFAKNAEGVDLIWL